MRTSNLDLHRIPVDIMQRITSNDLFTESLIPVNVSINNMVKLKNEVFVNGVSTTADKPDVFSNQSGLNTALRLIVNDRTGSADLLKSRVLNFIRYKAKASVYFLADDSIFASLDDMLDGVFELPAKWQASMRMPSDNIVRPVTSRGCCLVEDSIYYIDWESKIRAFDLQRLTKMHPQPICKMMRDLKFDGKTADLEYKNKAVSYLSPNGLIVRYPAAGKKMEPLSIDITKCSGYQFSDDGIFGYMVSNRKETVVTYHSYTSRLTGLFALSDKLVPLQAFYLTDQYTHAHSLKVVSCGQRTYFIALTLDSC